MLCNAIIHISCFNIFYHLDPYFIFKSIILCIYAFMSLVLTTDLLELSNTITTHNTVVVKWDLSSVPGCGDVSLTEEIRPRHGTGGIVNNTATFSGLQNGTTYTITVTATNRAGSMERMITVTTLGERSSTGMIILH